MDRRVKERLVGASILVVLIVLIVPELLSGPAGGPASPRLPVGAPEPVRNVTVDLATSKPTEAVAEPAAASSVLTSAAHGGTQNAAPGTGEPGGAAAGAQSAGGVTTAGAPTSAGGLTTAGAATSAASGTSAGAGNLPGGANASGSSNASAAAGDADGRGQGSSAAAPTPLETTPPPPTSKPGTAKLATSGHGWAVQLGSFASRANADKLARQARAQGFGVYVLSGGSGTAARYRVRVGPMADRNAAIQAEAKLKASGHAGSLVPPSP